MGKAKAKSKSGVGQGTGKKGWNRWEKGKNKADIPTKTFRRICREHASTAMNNQTRDFQRLG